MLASRNLDIIISSRSSKLLQLLTASMVARPTRLLVIPSWWFQSGGNQRWLEVWQACHRKILFPLSNAVQCMLAAYHAWSFEVAVAVYILTPAWRFQHQKQTATWPSWCPVLATVVLQPSKLYVVHMFVVPKPSVENWNQQRCIVPRFPIVCILCRFSLRCHVDLRTALYNNPKIQSQLHPGDSKRWPWFIRSARPSYLWQPLQHQVCVLGTTPTCITYQCQIRWNRKSLYLRGCPSPVSCKNLVRCCDVWLFCG